MDNGFYDFNGVQDEFDRLVQEINRIRNNRNANTRRNSENTEIVSLLREVLYLYNTNMREYHDNTRLIIQIIYSLINGNNNNNSNNNNTINRTVSTNERNNENNYFYYRRIPIINRNNTFDRRINLFNENVIVRPSNEQIINATITYEFDIQDNENNTNTNCPITLEDFQLDEQVCKIRHCGHTFRRDAIQNWFRSNVKCPVCRYDIRDYSANNLLPQETTNNETLSGQELENNLQNRMSNSLMSIIEQYYADTDLSQNLTYSFEFPIIYNEL
jgi:hypothetical protein